MSGRYTDHDYEHYERPRRHTRPRTKERPTYDDAADATVMTVDRGRYTLLVGDTTTAMAMKSPRCQPPASASRLNAAPRL